MKLPLLLVLIICLSAPVYSQTDTTLTERNLTLISDDLSSEQMLNLIERWTIAYGSTEKLDTVLQDYDQWLELMSPEAQKQFHDGGEELKEIFENYTIASFGFIYMCDNFNIEIMSLDLRSKEVGCSIHDGIIVYNCYDQTRRAKLMTIQPNPDAPLYIMLVKDENL